MTRSDEIRREQETLERRIEDGFVRILDAEEQGKDVAAWEAFWMTLLADYERLCAEQMGMP